MPFQKGKPRPPLKVKTCAICRKSFQPSSGAQKICGEPECKARSRMQKYLDKKAKETREERVVSPVPAKRKPSDLPNLELDLSPPAAYIKAMIADALTHAVPSRQERRGAAGDDQGTRPGGARVQAEAAVGTG